MFKERFQAIGIRDSGNQEEYVLICKCGWYKIEIFNSWIMSFKYMCGS